MIGVYSSILLLDQPCVITKGDKAKAPSLLCAMHPARLGYQCNDGAIEAWIPAYHVSAGMYIVSAV